MYVCWECVLMYSGVWGSIGHRARIGTLGFMAFIGLQVYVGRYTIILFQTVCSDQQDLNQYSNILVLV